MKRNGNNHGNLKQEKQTINKTINYLQIKSQTAENNYQNKKMQKLKYIKKQ